MGCSNRPCTTDMIHDVCSSQFRFCGSSCMSLLQGAMEKGKSWLEPNWGTNHVDPHMRWSSADVQS